MVGAKLARLGHFAIVSGGRDYGALKEFRQLNPSNTDPGICTENQNRLPRTNSCAADEHVPCGKKNQGYARGLIEIEEVGNWNHTPGRNRDQLAIAAIYGVAEHGEFAALILQAGTAFRTAIAKMHGREQDPLFGF